MVDNRTPRRVIVVGAGVVGLSCAVRLLEAGHRVDVVARDLPLETTSSLATALWHPWSVRPQDRMTDRLATSYAAFAGLAASPGTGVRMVAGTEVLAADASDAWWATAVPGLAAVRDPVPGRSVGRAFTAPVADMAVYLPWLAARVDELGGTITRLNLAALPDRSALVVNCAGIGARLLGSDHTVVPVRSQVAVLEQPGLERWWLDGDGPTYVVPRERDVLVGSSAEAGEWSRSPSPETGEAIVARACRLVPALRGARVLQHRVGLLPTRPQPRVERVEGTIHCYGLGGAGVTLSWGVAGEVVGLAALTGAAG